MKTIPRVVGIASDADGNRYWTVTANGLVIPGLRTPRYGSVGKKHLIGTIVGIAALPAGNGYYVVSSTGHVFAFGARALTRLGGSSAPVGPHCRVREEHARHRVLARQFDGAHLRLRHGACAQGPRPLTPGRRHHA